MHFRLTVVYIYDPHQYDVMFFATCHLVKKPFIRRPFTLLHLKDFIIFFFFYMFIRQYISCFNYCNNVCGEKKISTAFISFISFGKCRWTLRVPHKQFNWIITLDQAILCSMKLIIYFTLSLYISIFKFFISFLSKDFFFLQNYWHKKLRRGIQKIIKTYLILK